MKGIRSAASTEMLEGYFAADNTHRGRVVSVVLLFWIIGALILDLVHFMPQGEDYYLYLDLILSPLVAGFGLLIWQRARSPRRTQTAVFLFSLSFMIWAAVLAAFQATPYTLFVVAFFISTTLLLRQKESPLVYTSALITYVVVLTLRRGNPLAHGTAVFLEVLAMLVVACIVSILLYRQRVETIEAEEQLRSMNRSQEEEIAVRTRDLSRQLDERAVLLREIHHRVKNNLQILASILRLSEEYGSKEDPEAFLRGAERRIVSMAMVHQQLDDTENLENVDLKDYLRDLCTCVIGSYEAGSEILLRQDVESTLVSIDMALNLGLLTTEALSNALQHAFDPEQSERRVSISVHSHGLTLVLTVRDNGKGMSPELVENRVKGGLGLLLIESLSQQLHGSFAYDCSDGTTFRFELPLQ